MHGEARGEGRVLIPKQLAFASVVGLKDNNNPWSFDIRLLLFEYVSSYFFFLSGR